MFLIKSPQNTKRSPLPKPTEKAKAKLLSLSLMSLTENTFFIKTKPQSCILGTIGLI